MDDVPRFLARPVFQAEFGAGHQRVFSDRRADAGPFRDDSWPVVLIPYGLKLDPEGLSVLAAGARACGDRALIVCDMESASDEDIAFVVPWVHSAFEHARFHEKGWFSVVDCHLFGESGSWGGVAAASLDDVLCLGGDARFMAAWLDAAGGLDAVKRRFFEFARVEWVMSEDEQRRLLAMARWDTP